MSNNTTRPPFDLDPSQYEGFVPANGVDHSRTKAERAAMFEQMERELEEYERGLNPTQSPQESISYKYYRLVHPPRTVFKINQENLVSYKLDKEKGCWEEFPTFLVDFEQGNIMVEPALINDSYPTVSAVDQNKGIKL